MPAAVLEAGSTPAADNQENRHPRRNSLRNCGTGSALEGLYDVLNNEAFESQNSQRRKMIVIVSERRGCRGKRNARTTSGTGEPEAFRCP